jgi:hypothetical protein
VNFVASANPEKRPARQYLREADHDPARLPDRVLEPVPNECRAVSLGNEKYLADSPDAGKPEGEFGSQALAAGGAVHRHEIAAKDELQHPRISDEVRRFRKLRVERAFAEAGNMPFHGRHVYRPMKKSMSLNVTIKLRMMRRENPMS